MPKHEFERIIFSISQHQIVRRLTWRGYVAMFAVRGSIRLGRYPTAEELQELADARSAMPGVGKLEPGSLTIEKKGRKSYRIY